MNEKNMKNKKIYTRVGEIYTTGAYCAPMRLYIPHLGKDEWIWRVNRFEGGDSYMDGSFVEIADCADTREGLISEFTEKPEEKVVLTYAPVWVPADKSPASRSR